MRKSIRTWLRSLSSIFWPNAIDIAISFNEITACLHRNNLEKSLTFTYTFSNSLVPQGEAFYIELDDFLKELFSQASWKNYRVNFLLSADVVRYFFVTPFKKTQSLVDCIDAARYKFQQIYGNDDLANWDIQGQWAPDQSFLACAVPKKLLLTINACSEKNAFQIDTVQPHFISIWNQVYPHLSSKQWLLINEKTHLIIGITNVNGLAAIRTITSPINTHHTSSKLAAIIEREALCAELPIPDSILLIGKKELHWGDSLGTKIDLWADKNKDSPIHLKSLSALVKRNH